MVKYPGNLHSLFILTFIAFVIPCFCHPTDIVSCLIQHNIYNFTLFPGSQSTDYYRLLNFSLQNLRYAVPTEPKPVVIVIPQSLQQLVDSFRCCREEGFEFRVRSGGHSYEGISSVVPSGTFVIIDMMSLNQVWVDVGSETAWVEGGATLGETYYAVAEASNVHGFSAGSCPTVGVGGHIAGGGYGLLSRKYGLAADNVVDALLIDADGRVLDRKAMGEDVFWALRGGGGGVWGIVYAWKIKLLKVPETVTSCTMSRHGTKPYLAELLHEWQSTAPWLEPSFYLSVFVGFGIQGGEETRVSASFKGLYLGSRNEAMSILNRAFPELGVQKEECREMRWIESILYFSGLPNGSSISDLRNRYLEDKLYFKAKSDYVRTPISMEGLVTALDILEMEPKGSIVLDPYGGEMEKIRSDAIAFPHRKGNLFSIQYMVAWEEDSTAMSNKYIEWIRGFNKSMTPYVSWGPRAAYVNYMDLDLGEMKSSISSDDAVERARDWGEKYFLNNYDKLVKVKTFIDPDNVFNNQQGIPPMHTARLSNRSEGLGVSDRCTPLSYSERYCSGIFYMN